MSNHKEPYKNLVKNGDQNQEIATTDTFLLVI